MLEVKGCFVRLKMLDWDECEGDMLNVWRVF